MNLKVSMLIPTREREQLFRRFIDSVYRTTFHKKNINIYVICDEDDTISCNYVAKVIEDMRQHIEINLVTRQRTELLNEDYYNFLARQATGDLLWVLADDLELIHPGWDERVQETATRAFEKWPDRIICFSIKDNTPPPSHRIPKFPCFPMLTKEARNALGGWILHPKVPTWGADYVTYCIFEPIERLIQMHENNYLNHICFHNKQVEVDKTNERIGSIFNKTKLIPHHSTDRIIAEEVPHIRRQLLQIIKDFSSQQPSLP